MSTSKRTESNASGWVREWTFRFDGDTEKADRREAVIGQVATWYRDVTDGVDSTDVVAAYRDMAVVNDRLFREMPVTVEFTDGDPYESYEEMVDTVEQTGVLKIFAGGTHPEGLSREENLKGRAVHDWYGHIQMGVDFSFEGEYAKWRGMREHYSERAQRLLFTEVVGQLCVAHVLGGFDSPEFSQRGILAPDSVIDMVDRYMRFYSPF